MKYPVHVILSILVLPQRNLVVIPLNVSCPCSFFPSRQLLLPSLSIFPPYIERQAPPSSERPLSLLFSHSVCLDPFVSLPPFLLLLPFTLLAYVPFTFSLCVSLSGNTMSSSHIGVLAFCCKVEIEDR